MGFSKSAVLSVAAALRLLLELLSQVVTDLIRPSL